MNIRLNPSRARLLKSRGYLPAEIVEHMTEEGRNVGLAEVVAWINHREPPYMVDFRGERRSLYSVCTEQERDYATILRRLQEGMELEHALIMPVRVLRTASNELGGAA